MIGEWLAAHGQGWLLLPLGFCLMVGGPIALLVLFINSLVTPSAGSREGIAVGIAIGMWASISQLLVPYCGMYACLPGLALATKVNATERWQSEVIVHAVNFVLWPALGWGIFRLRSVMRRGGIDGQAGP